MEWKKATKKDERIYQIPADWLYIHYYEALNILFRFENSLRVFVYVILKNKFKEKWIDQNIKIEGIDTTIGALAKKRIAQAKVFGYLGYEVLCPLLHLTSGELVELITSDIYWKDFNDYFKGSREIMKTKLLEIGNVRNSLAHFRPIREDDVEVIKQNVKQTMMGIEDTLQGLFESYKSIPSNCDEDWYREMCVLGTNAIQLSTKQSNDEKWITLSLSYKSENIGIDDYGGYSIYYRTTNLMSNNILSNYPNFTKHIIYMTEFIPYSNAKFDDRLNLVFNKILSIVFNRECLISQHEEIISELKKILKQISDETDLVKEDNLARGTLIEIVRLSVKIKKNNENISPEIDKKPLRIEYTPVHPIEYWPDMNYMFGNFVTSTHRYPWVQTDVSELDFGF